MNCNYLTNSLHIDINGNVFPCTVSSSFSAANMGSIYNTSLEDIYKNIKEKNSSKCRDYCNRCLQYEKSFRGWNNSIEDYYFLDIRFDNVCNFMCRMCSGENSIAFKKEDASIKEKNISSLILKNISFINKFKKIYIGGGEPFLSPFFYTFLELLSKNKTILLSSNISIIKSDILNALKQFNKVIFYPSIDGIDEIGSYIRQGFKTDIFFKNFDILKTHFTCIPVVTVSALNILSLDKIIKKLSNYTDINAIYLNILDSPKEFHISVLPSYLKTLYSAKIGSIKTLLTKDFIIDAPYNLYYGLENIDIALSTKTTLDFNNTKRLLSNVDLKRNQDYKILFEESI